MKLYNTLTMPQAHGFYWFGYIVAKPFLDTPPKLSACYTPLWCAIHLQAKAIALLPLRPTVQIPNLV